MHVHYTYYNGATIYAATMTPIIVMFVCIYLHVSIYVHTPKTNWSHLLSELLSHVKILVYVLAFAAFAYVAGGGGGVSELLEITEFEFEFIPERKPCTNSATAGELSGSACRWCEPATG